ncbi:tripartite tricarboxylate transporter TctB family protein [Algicella marina]|uniref:Tripartite tricarboxylate transporter TctB family protein n=1 Tax=Algicella marina TaxID=2683284 RepID=A0A6P1SZD6_9RHOB|nr:tripartite tricarboxylate transporter TctB family protein [Algicella marina]QHQ36054.1 tripartite tricarboxylate transporter TctB family protein [Algicella marina]
MASDRIFGLVVLFTALAYFAGATQIQTGFMSDPVGPKTFPYLVSGAAALAALVLIFKPDPDPAWPATRTLANMGIAVVVLVAYAYLLKPLGFIVPTILAAGILSYQIEPRAKTAALSGVGLAIGLFIVFRFALGLSLRAFPHGWGL